MNVIIKLGLIATIILIASVVAFIILKHKLPEDINELAYCALYFIIPPVIVYLWILMCWVFS